MNFRTPDDLLKADRQQREFKAACKMQLAAMRREVESADAEQAAELLRELTGVLRELAPVLLLIALRDDITGSDTTPSLERAYSHALGDQLVKFADGVKAIRDELAAQLDSE